MTTTHKASMGGMGTDGHLDHNSPQVKSASVGAAIKTYTLTVTEQDTNNILPGVIKAAPDFVNHLTLSQTNAQNFITVIDPAMDQNLTNLLAFSNQWHSFYPNLIKFAKAGDSDQVATGIKYLKVNVDSYHTTASHVHTQLLNFNKKIEVDAGNFSSDYSKLTSATKGIPAEIKAQSKAIDAEQKVVDDGVGMIVGGAVATITGGLMFVAGAVADVFTAGTSTPLAVAGVAVAAGGVGLIVAGSVMINKASEQIAKDTALVAQYKTELAQLKGYQGTMIQLKNSTANAVTAFSSMASAWDFLYQDLDAVEKALKSAKGMPPAWVVPTLNAANKDWTQVGLMAANIQKQVIDAQIVKLKLTPNHGLLQKLPVSFNNQIKSNQHAA